MFQRRSILICFLLLMAPISCIYAQQVDSSLADVDQNIGLWMKEWHIPGMAVGVVRDGKTLLYKGYGLRDVDKQLPVTPKTVFSIASISKAFTSLSAALLVDAGKLGWDQPVVELVPEFKTADSFTNRQTTIRDMLCHRTGLADHFMLYDIYPSDRERLFSSLQYAQSSFGFRQKYHYSNVVITLAGYIVGRISGLTWEDFVQKNIFDPLDMDNSSFDLNIQQAAEFACPYDYKENMFHRTAFRDTRSTNPSGGINASLDDMIKWLELYLNGGKVDEKQLISAKNLTVTYTPQIVTDFIPWSTTSPIKAYGLGWTIEVYRGHTFISHGGMLSNRYACWVAWLPKDKIGIVILSNADTVLPYYLSYIIVDKLIGIDISYWNSILAEGAKNHSKSSEPEQAPTESIPSSLMDDLKGIYFNPAYGNAEVKMTDTRLVICFSERVQIPLSYVNDSTLKALYQKYEYPFEIRLTRDRDGRVISLTGAFCPWEEVRFGRISDAGQR